jgi:hypothetical protein
VPLQAASVRSPGRDTLPQTARVQQVFVGRAVNGPLDFIAHVSALKLFPGVPIGFGLREAWTLGQVGDAKGARLLSVGPVRPRVGAYRPTSTFMTVVCRAHEIAAGVNASSSSRDVVGQSRSLF